MTIGQRAQRLGGVSVVSSVLRRAGLVFVFGATVSGCSGREAGSPNSAVPDFVVSSEPKTVIAGTGQNYEFYRIVGIAVLTNGDVVVADGSTQELRLFSAAGDYVRTLSRAGEGPGELKNMVRIDVRHDTIVVLEGFPGPPQLHLFDPNEGFLARTRLDPAGTPRGVSPLGSVSSSRFLVQRGGVHRVVVLPADGELRRDSIELGLLAIDGLQSVRWMGWFPNTTWFSYELPSGRRVLGHYSLGPSLVLAASATSIWVGDTESGTILLFDSTGTASMHLAFPLPPRPFDEVALERARTLALARVSIPDVSGRRAWTEGLYAKAYRPATAPRFVRFIPGVGGELWVEAYSENPQAAHVAAVLDSAGTHIGNATIPGGTVPHIVTEERLIGVEVDSLGVEHVVIYGIRR